jgi:hypothetical protein
MKMIYIVSYWLPFPSSEYGGVQVVIAENDEECVQVLIGGADSWEKEAYPNYADCIIEQVSSVPRSSPLMPTSAASCMSLLLKEVCDD